MFKSIGQIINDNPKYENLIRREITRAEAEVRNFVIWNGNEEEGTTLQYARSQDRTEEDYGRVYTIIV